jgi:PPK2 family polyphosphate:nucleotide phosphotransferase
MDPYRVQPGTRVDLRSFVPQYSGDLSKAEGKDQLKQLADELADLQELLYAEGMRKLLIVLQGIDTSGKDGTIRHVFGEVNPQGTKVASFKAPSREELAHDYLWRIHPHTPGKGEIVIFNRSHYEDVLVVRVHNLVPRQIWERRYDHINAFERMLVDEGATIRKFFLHISKKEQAERFLARIDRPHKRWKFNPDDLEERQYWNEYQQAFSDMLSRTSTPWAPWYVIPSDRKWYRNLSVARVIVDTLKTFDMRYPKEVPDIDSFRSRLQKMVEEDPA